MDLIHIAIEAAREAGALLEEGFGTHFTISSKEGKQNLVTEYDLASQEFLLKKLSSHFPHHHFLAEENVTADPDSDEVLWVIDPLDGTVNFAHHLPIFSISIAAIQKGEVLCGVVYQPMTKELFSSELGSGAFLNQSKLQVSSSTQLESSLVATGFPYDVDQNPLKCIDRFTKFVSKGIPIRRLGSAAIDLAYVAAGRYDAFWEVGLHSWDMAAGKLLIEEAGGRVSHYDGSPHPLFGYHPLLATNGHLHDAMVSQLKEDLWN